MKNLSLSLSVGICCMIMCGCSQVEENPFFTDFQTPYGTPDFNRIRTEHYEPAFLKGIEEQNVEIDNIVNNQEAPTFENTINALDNSGQLLNRVSLTFFALTEADTNENMAALEEKFAPLLSEQNDNIYQNMKLYERVKLIKQQADEGAITLDKEQARLLKKIYDSFVRSGAALDAQAQARLREINKELSTLSTSFGNHVLNENNAFKMIVTDKHDLAGLPEWVVAGAAEEAKAIGQEGKWVFTLQESSRLPFLQYSARRDLRKQLYLTYINRGNNNDANDNKEIIKRIVTLRVEKAKLLGFDCYSNYVLDQCMAKNEKAVMDFLNNLWGYSLQNAKKEAAELQAIMDKEGRGEKLEGWDWWYYAEKLRQEKYNLNEDEIKPYFSIENVQKGLFHVVNQLYGIQMKPIDDVPVYEPDVKTYRVEDADGSLLGIFYADYFPRAGKRGGAWMSIFREQKGEQRPLVYNVASFTKPAGDIPSLLTLDEVETMFHEFGHGLHGLLTKCNYFGTAGTNVARDFVELPSQIMEHWAVEPEVLKHYAVHYKTGETIPDSLIQKIQNLSTFNQGFNTTELLAASLLDMYLHNITSADKLGDDIMAFEKARMDELGLIPQIAPRYRATYFNHIVGSGYAAGYYSYLWAEVLDADAFEAFKERGIFDQATATAFRTQVLERGDSDDPMNLYRTFRGAEPNNEALLRNRGLK